MRVSIIMCSYNTSKYIEEAVESIINQTYTDWELIISDDRSTDNTVELIKQYTDDPRVTLYEQPVNLGYLANKNSALKMATGELVTQLDADDVSKPERIEKQVAAFKQLPDLMICGTNYELIDMDGNYLESKEYKEDYMITTPELEYPFWFPGLMFKPQLLEEFGYFHDYFKDIYGDDHYWTLTVVNKYPIYFVKDVLYSYRINPNSLTNVMDNERKMFAQDVVAELHRQIKETGTDWLQQGQREKLHKFEQELLNNKKILAERYRVWAAKYIDNKNWAKASKLLSKHFKNSKTDPQGYRTLVYYIRKRYLGA